jgi:hypothetical protein
MTDTNYTRFELMDRLATMQAIWGSIIEDHPALLENKSLQHRAENIQMQIADLYQEVSNQFFDGLNPPA